MEPQDLGDQEILDSGVHFTAVLASNDESALGAMKALQEAGRSIPQDVAVIGFDDRPESAVHRPPLSSVRIPLSKMGYRAVESLYRYLTGQTETIETGRVTTSLVPRTSCGCDQSTLHIATPTSIRSSDGAAGREALVQAMAAPLLIKARTLSADPPARAFDRGRSATSGTTALHPGERAGVDRAGG
ncbi:MAG: substrate-binding domain-containing protein, partial [Anaerolineales bacterium]